MYSIKKLLCLLLVSALLLTFAACGKDTDTPDDPKKPAASDPAKTPDTPEQEGEDDEQDVPDTPEQEGEDDEQDVPDDGSVKVLLPTICYFSEAHDPNDANHLEYDAFGNMTMFRIVGENLNKEQASTVETDADGRVTYVSNFHRDTYRFTYGEDGAMTQISGSMNYGEDDFVFERSQKEGCAYQLKILFEKNYVIEQYTEDYRLIEQLYYTYDNDTEPFHRRYCTYDENGVLTKWEKSYDGRYDFTDEYDADDFCQMGHCIHQYKINGANFVFTEYTYDWTSTVETDGEGRVIKDHHQCPDVQFEVTYDYTYGDDGEISAFGYTIVDTETDSYASFAYTPVALKCDPLQMALIMIYSRDVYPNNFGSFRDVTVQCAR